MTYNPPNFTRWIAGQFKQARSVKGKKLAGRFLLQNRIISPPGYGLVSCKDLIDQRIVIR